MNIPDSSQGKLDAPASPLPPSQTKGKGAEREDTGEKGTGAFDGITPGPWRWGGQRNREVRLESLAHGIPQVMAFRRKGMQCAEPVFWDRSDGGDPMFSGTYCTATERAVREKDYREDVIAIDVPDARLIAAAPVLLDLVRRAVALDPHNAIAQEFAALEAALSGSRDGER